MVIGQGVFIVILQCLAVSGNLLYIWLVVLLLGAGILGLLEWRRRERHLLLWSIQAWQKSTKPERYGFLLAAIFVIPTLLAPLSPPFPGDELLYHLPHAQQWAQTGHLVINEWLRYPWFPYNYNLLFAGAYVIYDDVFTHMFNTLAGLLVAIITYRLGAKYFHVAVGVVSTIIWMQILRGDFGKANVDMGVTLYVLSASIAFYWWMNSQNDRRWLAISAFLIGVAVGSKYQGLLFLPFFGLALVWIDRRANSWLIATIALLIPSLYWYLRNAILTGDPFDPMGGNIFGFFDWDHRDYVNQFEDLKRHSGFPNWLLWPAVLSVFSPSSRRSPVHIATILLCTYTIVVWMVTSHLPRYLMPVFPLLALLAAEQWCLLFKRIFVGLKNFITPAKICSMENAAWLIVFVAISISSGAAGKRYWDRIATNQEERREILKKVIPGYSVLEYANANKMGRIYIVGGLTDAIYYAPHPIWGDAFGPWRHLDIVSNDPIIFAGELSKRNFDAVIADGSLCLELERHPSFKKYFSIVFQEGGARLYRLERQ
jgi:4-amino-4-deoxy-L-arabinose transferase-like glycosyltransferase